MDLICKGNAHAVGRTRIDLRFRVLDRLRSQKRGSIGQSGMIGCVSPDRILPNGRKVEKPQRPKRCFVDLLFKGSATAEAP